MNKKQQRKFAKRARIAAVRGVQDAWIKEYGLEKPMSRRERDRRFGAAQSLNLILAGAPHVMA